MLPLVYIYRLKVITDHKNKYDLYGKKPHLSDVLCKFSNLREDFPFGSANPCYLLNTRPEGNSSFCFPRISMFPGGAAEGNIEIRGKQNELFPEGRVIKWFVV